MAERDFDITLNPALAFRIAQLAREYASESDAAIPDDEKVDDDMGDDPMPGENALVDAEASEESGSIEMELSALIDGLSLDAQKDLLALVWLGRDGGSPLDWHRVRRQAGEVCDLHVARYLKETPLAAEFLEEGLSSLGYYSD
jgi:hypothetical protein